MPESMRQSIPLSWPVKVKGGTVQLLGRAVLGPETRDTQNIQAMSVTSRSGQSPPGNTQHTELMRPRSTIRQRRRTDRF